MSNIQLTFTQCKQLNNNGVDIREFLSIVNDQPNYIQAMGEYSSDVESACEDYFCEGINFDPSTDSWSGLAVQLVSTAVEAWCSQFADVLDGVN